MFRFPMRYPLLLTLLAAGLACIRVAAAAPCDVAAAPWLSVEIVATEWAGDDAAEFIEIDAAGCMTARYAAFDIRRGVYQRALRADEIDRLRALASAPALANTTQATLQQAVDRDVQRMQKRKSDGSYEVFEVVCGDTHRLRIATGKQAKTLAWEGLREYARHLPGVVELDAMVELVDALRATADPQQAKRIATVQP